MKENYIEVFLNKINAKTKVKAAAFYAAAFAVKISSNIYMKKK